MPPLWYSSTLQQKYVQTYVQEQTKTSSQSTGLDIYQGFS
jgi:hypothetical protein